MSTKAKAKTKTTKSKEESLEALPLPKLWERFKEATGGTTKSPNKKFLITKIAEALAARATESESEPAPAPQPPAKRTARPSEPVVATTEPTDIDAPKPRGRFASMTIGELQARYLEVVQRPTSSVARTYLIWKIREAEKGRINVGPRKTRERNGEPVDVKILPLRLEAEVVERMDEAWRTRGIKNRMEFFRGAIGHYLAQLGARDAAALFTNAGTTGA